MSGDEARDRRKEVVRGRKYKNDGEREGEKEEGGLFSGTIIPCDFQILFANKSKVDFMLQPIDVYVLDD